MGNRKSKTVGEGGAHSHRLASNLKETMFDGVHKHLYFINDRLLMTDLDGSHSHPINVGENEVGPEAEKHMHTVGVRTVDGPLEFQTSQGEPLDMNCKQILQRYQVFIPIF